MGLGIDLPDNNQIQKDILQKLETLPKLNVFRLFAGLPEIFNPLLSYVTGLYQFEFDPRLREIAICRQSYIASAPYVLHQHKLLAKSCGVTDNELNIIISDGELNELDEDALLMCQMAEELEKNAALTDTTFGRLLERFGQRWSSPLKKGHLSSRYFF